MQQQIAGPEAKSESSSNAKIDDVPDNVVKLTAEPVRLENINGGVSENIS